MQNKGSLLLFKALGEETKHRILLLLMKGEYCACEIPSLVKRTQSNTSMHLSKLLEWKIVKSRRKGKMILYSLRDKKVAAVLRVVD